jgi:PPM family protein phosphatase
MSGEKAFGLTDKGLSRERNEDAFALFPTKNLYIVADGMGGYTSGDIASASVVKSISDFFSSERIEVLHSDAALYERLLSDAVNGAHGKLRETVQKESEGGTVGATTAIAMIGDRYLHTCHVGDSRVYIINPSGITQITNDHSNVGDLVRIGQLSSSDARVSPIRNQVTQALGSPFGVKPEYHMQPLRAGDLVLLCTDGLWDMIQDETILAIVREAGGLEAGCRELVRRANEAGGGDNITVVMVRVESQPSGVTCRNG